MLIIGADLSRAADRDPAQRAGRLGVGQGHPPVGQGQPQVTEQPGGDRADAQQPGPHAPPRREVDMRAGVAAPGLEGAVIAPPIEALTRQLDCALVASDALITQVRTEIGEVEVALAQLVRQPEQTIRGIERPIAVWTQG